MMDAPCTRSWVLRRSRVDLLPGMARVGACAL
ncbi:hypothetical protein SEA_DREAMCATCHER_92 [Mycobacterium phage DreamCatcher]|nr:hypothetical protein SEA_DREAMCATCHER_92 [Mycobacterium phage DreamCatcher]